VFVLRSAGNFNSNKVRKIRNEEYFLFNGKQLKDIELDEYKKLIGFK